MRRRAGRKNNITVRRRFYIFRVSRCCNNGQIYKKIKNKNTSNTGQRFISARVVTPCPRVRLLFVIRMRSEWDSSEPPRRVRRNGRRQSKSI